MKKKFVTILTLCVMVISSISFVSATGIDDIRSNNASNYIISPVPLWNDTNDVTPMISSNGKNISAGLYIDANRDTAIRGRFYLEKYVSGNWKVVKSWYVNETENVFMEKSYNGASSGKYRSRIKATIGTDKINLTSVTLEI